MPIPYQYCCESYAQMISCIAAYFFFFDVPGRLLLLGRLEGTASMGTSSIKQESLKLISVVMGMLSYLISLSLRMA